MRIRHTVENEEETHKMLFGILMMWGRCWWWLCVWRRSEKNTRKRSGLQQWTMNRSFVFQFILFFFSRTTCCVVRDHPWSSIRLVTCTNVYVFLSLMCSVHFRKKSNNKRRKKLGEVMWALKKSVKNNLKGKFLRLAKNNIKRTVYQWTVLNWFLR